MKFLVERNDKEQGIYKKYELEFSISTFQELTEKDKEKIYRIIRIIDSLGNDEINETTDKEYRFQSDDDEGTHLLDGVVKDVTKG